MLGVTDDGLAVHRRLRRTFLIEWAVFVCVALLLDERVSTSQLAIAVTLLAPVIPLLVGGMALMDGVSLAGVVVSSMTLLPLTVWIIATRRPTKWLEWTAQGSLAALWLILCFGLRV